MSQPTTLPYHGDPSCRNSFPPSSSSPPSSPSPSSRPPPPTGSCKYEAWLGELLQTSDWNGQDLICRAVLSTSAEDARDRIVLSGPPCSTMREAARTVNV